MTKELMKHTKAGRIRIVHDLEPQSPAELADVLFDTVIDIFVQLYGKDRMDDGVVPEAEMIQAMHRFSDATSENPSSLEDHLAWVAKYIRENR